MNNKDIHKVRSFTEIWQDFSQSRGFHGFNKLSSAVLKVTRWKIKIFTRCEQLPKYGKILVRVQDSMASINCQVAVKSDGK